MTDASTAEYCPNCLKPWHLCVCEALAPVATPLQVVILQHPQEKRETLGTAHIAHLQIAHSILRAGLSWPSLRRIVERDADPKRWGVLYLGPARAGDAPRLPPVAAVDKKGNPLPDSKAILAGLEGIIVLDGTWSQAKTLWWRNAWLLKCRRLVINPPVRSLYGAARREPRRDSLSTLESVAFVLETLLDHSGLYDQLLAPFALLLKKNRAPRPRPPILPAAAESEGQE
jgi:DTW domain-containing protein